MNKVTLLGRLGRDCDVRSTEGGTCVVNVSIAVSRRVSKGEGKWENETTWVDVTLWGRRGEAFSKHHRKGAMCLIEGRLTLDEWKDRDSGDRRTKLKVTAEDWHFVDSGEPEEKF